MSNPVSGKNKKIFQNVIIEVFTQYAETELTMMYILKEEMYFILTAYRWFSLNFKLSFSGLIQRTTKLIFSIGDNLHEMSNFVFP